MNSYIVDIFANVSLMALVATVLIAIIIEAVKTTRPIAVYYVSLAGLTTAGFFSFLNFETETQSFGGMIRHGGYANFFNVLFCITAILVAIIARNYFEKKRYNRGEFYILLLFAVIGMMLIASANDLIILFLGIELMSICLYVLAGIVRVKEHATEAALKYFLLGAFSTGFLLYGIALIYGTVGTTNLMLIRNVFAVVSTNYLFLLGAGLLIVGLSFKAAAVPFHMWAPDVYEGSSTPVTAFMSTAAKAAAFTAFITIFIRTFDFFGGRINEAIAIIAAASMIFGNIAAIGQSNIKRMLAYSSIAHAGYMLIGIASGSIEGQVGVMFYLVAYTFMNVGAFAIVAIIENEEEKNLQLDDYLGLHQTQPVLSALMAIFMFALSGIPPFAGFFGKYFVFYSAIKSNLTWLAVIGVLTSFISAYYYIRIVALMYFRESKTASSIKIAHLQIIVVIICAVLTLFFGLFPSSIVQIAQRFF